MHPSSPATGSTADNPTQDRFAGANWHVEVLGKNGWQPLRQGGGGPVLYPSEEEAVAAAVREWEKSDRPARPALAAPE